MIWYMIYKLLGSMWCYVKNTDYEDKFVKCKCLSRGAELWYFCIVVLFVVVGEKLKENKR